MALFDVTDFEGPIVKDFFEDDGYFADVDQFWAAQGTEIEWRKAAYLEDGWSSVEIIPPISHFNDWQYAKTPKRKGGRVYIQVKAKGEATTERQSAAITITSDSVSVSGRQGHKKRVS
jgi:ParB family transcriptional regulator, chromosome partitioning protein